MVRQKVISQFDFPSPVCKLFHVFQSMNPAPFARLFAAALIALAVLIPGSAGLAVPSIPGGWRSRWRVGWNRDHYTREKLDDKFSERFLQTYLTTLDYNRLCFTQQDIDQFRSKYSTTLGDSVLRGDLGPAREIFARFRQQRRGSASPRTRNSLRRNMVSTPTVTLRSTGRRPPGPRILRKQIESGKIASRRNCSRKIWLN